MLRSSCNPASAMAAAYADGILFLPDSSSARGPRLRDGIEGGVDRGRAAGVAEAPLAAGLIKPQRVRDILRYDSVKRRLTFARKSAILTALDFRTTGDFKP